MNVSLACAWKMIEFLINNHHNKSIKKCMINIFENESKFLIIMKKKCIYFFFYIKSSIILVLDIVIYFLFIIYKKY